jgi:hypothetical protein
VDTLDDADFLSVADLGIFIAIMGLTKKSGDLVIFTLCFYYFLFLLSLKYLINT